MITPCLCCGRALTSAIGDGSGPPLDATVLVAHGNYGSSLWDQPLQGRDFLQVNVCDGCLGEAAKAGEVLLVEPVPSALLPAPKMGLWRPEPDEAAT